MSFFPILKAPNALGVTTIHNFSPNNWENNNNSDKYVFLTYLEDDIWRSQKIDLLSYRHSTSFSEQELSAFSSTDSLKLLSLSDKDLPEYSESIPVSDCLNTYNPYWRATLSLKTNDAMTSYQGELPVFPSSASLLSFSPFLQFGERVKNYVLLLNIEKEPVNRQVVIEFFNAKDKSLLGVKEATSNQINIISLDDFLLEKDHLPVIVCRDMAAIPLYFSIYNNGEFMSLEHTHPPASLVTHGDRFGAQKHLKELWFSKLQNIV